MDRGYLATYLRISDDDIDLGEDKRESNSILNQRRGLEDYISNHEELSQYPVKEFVDDGVSGVSFNRPGIQNLLNEVKEKKVHLFRRGCAIWIYEGKWRGRGLCS